MIPSEPLPPELEVPNPPPAPPPSEAYWDYQDLGVFLGLSVLSLFVALLTVLYIPFLHALPMPYKLVIGQLIWYVLVFGSLAAILRLRYDGAFWSSLGWRPTRVGAAVTSFFTGPLLAVAVGLAGAALRTPQIKLPFEDMLKGPALLILFSLLVVVIGPVC